MAETEGSWAGGLRCCVRSAHTGSNRVTRGSRDRPSGQALEVGNASPSFFLPVRGALTACVPNVVNDNILGEEELGDRDEQK